MRIGVIFFFVLSCVNLIQLLYTGPFWGAKVEVNINTQAIVMQSILVLILGYLSFKLKWD